MNPSAEIIDVCVRTPTVDDATYAWGYRSAKDETVSVTHRAAFEEFAPRAEVFYWYDPLAPSDSPERLPWPYHHLQCTTQSGRAPSLPKEMTRVDLSYEAREALVSILTQQCAPAPEAPEASAGMNGVNKQFLGQVGTPISVSSRKTFTSEHVEEVTKTLKDALKGKINDLIDYGPLGPTAAKTLMPPHLVVNAPKTTGQSIDSPAAQFVGGFISEVPAATVPGGALVTDTLIATGVAPEGTREARLGKALADMGVGAGQTFIGVDATVIGGGATLTGAGTVVGVPMCVGGLALATNGVITFCNGTRNLVVVLYNWNGDEVTAEAAAPNQTPAATNPQQTSTQGAPPASPPAAKPPPEPPPPAAKPAPSTPSGQTGGSRKHYGSGVNKTANSTSWVKCTGQVHHAITAQIHRELQNHATLKNLYKYRDDRFVTQAIDKAAHNGWEKWHRSMEDEVIRWLQREAAATPAQFEEYLRNLYRTHKELAPRFPNGL